MNAKPFALSVAALALLVACSSPSPSPSSSPSPSRSAAALVLGPDGLGPIKLAKPLADALATGLIDSRSGDDAVCTVRGRIKDALPSETSDNGLIFAGKLGVTAVYAYADVATPEGIRLGSSYAEVKAAYADWHDAADSDDPQNFGRGYGKVAGNPDAIYRIVLSGGKVSSLGIQLRHQDCYE